MSVLGDMTVQKISKYCLGNMGPRREKFQLSTLKCLFSFINLSESVFRSVTGMFDLGEDVLLDTNDLPFAVYLSSLQTPQPSSKYLGLMRYRGNLSQHLGSTLCECKSPQLEESDLVSSHNWATFVFSKFSLFLSFIIFINSM